MQEVPVCDLTLFYWFCIADFTFSTLVQAQPAKGNGLTYEFAAATSNTTLRGHLEKFHEDKYVCLAKEHGWTMQLAKHRAREEGKATQTTLDGIAQTGIEN